MKKIIFIILLFFSHYCYACTAFGAITTTGTIIAKNRDYYYGPQNVGIVQPSQQLRAWYGNTYHHHNIFFGLTASDGVSMGVNPEGLTAIEEDALLPQHTQEVALKKTGTPNGMVLYGVLQNFNSVNEMIPYLEKIFGHASPDFYQFSDAKKILTVEVAFGKDKNTFLHPFSYHIFSRLNSYFTHTNTYLTPAFVSFDRDHLNPDSLKSTNNRLKTMTGFVSHTKTRNIQTAARWFWNTYSTVSSKDNKNECLNTSIFRSNLQGLQSINLNVQNNIVYGTASTMIISNDGNLHRSHIYLKIIKSIVVQKNHMQLIRYKVLHTTLFHLFNGEKLIFVQDALLRKMPINGLCQ